MFKKGNQLGNRKGRKKASHTIAAAKAREHLVNSIAEEMEPIVTAQKEAAKGMYVEKEIGKKKVIVYRITPDLKAGEYLLNQVAGKARETIEHEGGPIVNIDKAIILNLERAYGGKFIGNGKVDTAV